LTTVSIRVGGTSSETRLRVCPSNVVRPKMGQNCFGTEHPVILRHNGINREPLPPARMIAHRSCEFVLSLQFMLQL
jgi:hypothetical protein